jgi:hypothetical protein
MGRTEPVTVLFIGLNSLESIMQERWPNVAWPDIMHSGDA